jgi:hypothetical protein
MLLRLRRIAVALAAAVALGVASIPTDAAVAAVGNLWIKKASCRRNRFLRSSATRRWAGPEAWVTYGDGRTRGLPAKGSKPLMTQLPRHYHEALPCFVKAASRSRSSCGLVAPHLAWKESALAFVCYAIPAVSISREGRPVSGTGRPLVAATIWVSTAVAIRRGHLVGAHMMGTRVCHGAWRNTDSERHDERKPSFGHHHEVPLKISPISKAFQQPKGTALSMLRCDQKSLCDELH